ALIPDLGSDQPFVPLGNRNQHRVARGDPLVDERCGNPRKLISAFIEERLVTKTRHPTAKIFPANEKVIRSRRFLDQAELADDLTLKTQLVDRSVDPLAREVVDLEPVDD